MFYKNKIFWISLLSLIVFLGVSYCLYMLILYDDEITESKGVIEISVEGKPVNIADMVIISFAESDVAKPITIENTGKKIYLDMNTWDKSKYEFKVLIDKCILGEDKIKINKLQHMFVYSPAHIDMEAIIKININYYYKNDIWYADIIYEKSNPEKHGYKETFSLEEGMTFMSLGP